MVGSDRVPIDTNSIHQMWGCFVNRPADFPLTCKIVSINTKQLTEIFPYLFQDANASELPTLNFKNVATHK